LSVDPEPDRVIVPAPVCINWQLKPIGKVGTVTITAVDELIKNNLLLSVVPKVNPLVFVSITNPPDI
jgi:hypothetical protein